MNPLQDLGALISAVAAAYQARFGDVQKDFLAVEDLEQLLADVGVPDAALAKIVTEALAAVVSVKAAAGNQAWLQPGPAWGRSGFN